MMPANISASVAELRELARESGLAVALNWAGKERGELVHLYARGAKVPVKVFAHLHDARRWLQEGNAWRL